ncbi:hypothetical protein [Variovorax sp. Sphag1AA]|uniref:hypothetical protein n=1 Tax=Variovorax sp. Sphag1AA TaxID=2587027 RepID=UPI00161F4F6A|nr:hypothetical protein [Variovorax sp. Sphag1AA]MBB3177940.1 hypothetical protein [Variovorax sp. Sphag1AA]
MDKFLLPVELRLQGYIDELNAQGALGFVQILQMPLDNEGSKRVYAKDVSRDATFFYYKLPDVSPPDAASILQRHNEEGAKGASIYPVTWRGSSVMLYRIASDCSRPRC